MDASINRHSDYSRDTLNQTPQTSPDAVVDLSISLMRLLRLKDQNTLEHSHRVFELTQEWSDHMRSRGKWVHLNLKALETAALLHDVGKIGVLDQILLKPHALDPIEREALEQHPEIGYQMVRDFPQLTDVAAGIRHHHERFDGKGYPLGLKGTHIPAISRIIAIVDAYDAMVSDRPYRKGRAAKLALEEIAREAGQQFCPEFVSNFLQFMHARNS